MKYLWCNFVRWLLHRYECAACGGKIYDAEVMTDLLTRARQMQERLKSHSDLARVDVAVLIAELVAEGATGRHYY